jgi:hypothetical protein
VSTYRAIFTITDPWGCSQTVGGERVFEPEPPLYRVPEKRTIGFDLRKARDQ